MGKILGWITGPAGSLVDSVGSIIDNLHTSDDEKLKARIALQKLEREFQQSLLEADQRWAETQASVIRAEVSSKSWMASNWRPILMLVFTYIVAHNFVIAPMFSLPLTEVPENMWELLKLGMGGYILGRSGEKIAAQLKR